MCKKIIANKGILALILIIAILIIDQTIKIAVKTSMSIGESIRITNWFYIYFIENNGMAYGVTLVNKLFLSVLRVIILLSMIFAGAVGNILDSMFYGLIFSSSTPFNISTIVDFGSGYSGFLMGKVVDMFYFPIIHTTWPAWFPFVGGNEFIFFSPIFNFADASVTTGIICLFLFCTKDMGTIGDTFSNAIKRYKNR